MTAARTPHVSFVLATHNRRTVVLNTLSRLAGCGLGRDEFEVIVVDNASTDGTVEAVADHCDVLLPMGANTGSCAKQLGVERARGRYVVFLDDDSYPRPDAVPAMIRHFEADLSLGAAGFTIHLPDGRLEGAALPEVFVGCGVGFRAEALRQVGGLDATFFMQAEEYDLAFRLAAAGWQVRVFDDLHLEHLKTDHARRCERTLFYDVRNNLRVFARHLPGAASQVYRRDALQRYRWFAQRDGFLKAFVRGACAGRVRAAVERVAFAHRRLDPASFERFFRWNYIVEQMLELVCGGAQCIAFVDLGKNVYAYWQGARRAGLEVLAVGDDRFAAPRRRYRGIPVVGFDAALRLPVDAFVVSDSSPVHGTAAWHRALNGTVAPVHHWFPGPSEADQRRRVLQESKRMATSEGAAATPTRVEALCETPA